MRSSLVQLITRNWPIKGAALFLALMLYVAVQLQQPVTTSFDVTLTVLLPPGRALLQKPPTVRVQISGKGSQILKLRSLTGDMGLIAERSFGGIPVETGAGAITSFIVTPPRVSVAVRGPEERVLALTRDSLRVVAHITGATTSGGVARITVIAPRGITARAIPDSVTLRRRSPPPAPRRRG